MSDFAALSAIFFLGIMGFWINAYIARMANGMGLRICTGVVDGTPVPTAVRWHILYNMWVPYQSGGFMAVIFAGAAQLIMASLVGNEDVKLLAYLAAVMALVGGLFWGLTGVVIFINHYSVLRKAEAD